MDSIKQYFGTQSCEKKCGRDECVFKCAYPIVLRKVECCAKGGDVNTGLFNCDRGECIHADMRNHVIMEHNEIEYSIDVLLNEVSRLRDSLKFCINDDNISLVKTYVPQLYNAINMLRRHDKLTAEIKSLQCECNNYLEVICHNCNGTGQLNAEPFVECHICSGIGHAKIKTEHHA